MSDPRYPHDEIGEPGDTIGSAGSDAGGPHFFDAPSPTANDVTSTVQGWTVGTTVATTDVWQEIWQPGIDQNTVASGIQGDASTRPTVTYAMVARAGEVWEGVGGEPPQPNIGG